ncbi:hypothetical protein CPB85DRAFT_425512 [Mucidula mucida]|nr:hypothetical protein CPB85DRAFT_425512 [Mucidula mucida]
MGVRISLTLANNGSVARDHLASERTFLAYVRTSLALASVGVGLVQLFSLEGRDSGGVISPTSNALREHSRPLGASALIFGLLVLMIGVTRYFSVQQKLTYGLFPVARLFTVGMTACIAAMLAVMFGIILAKH